MSLFFSKRKEMTFRFFYFYSKELILKKFFSKYFCFTSNSLKVMYTYRFRIMVWIIGDFTFLGVEYYLWTAIFKANNGVLYNYSLKQYISYLVAGLLCSRITECFLDFEVAEDIKLGHIIMKMLKPVNYVGMNFARHLGLSVGNAMNLIPLVLFTGIFIGFQKVSFFVGISFFLSILMAYIIKFFFIMFLGMTAFWLTNVWGLLLFKGHMLAIFSGQLMAISLFFKIGTSETVFLPVSFISENVIRHFFLGLGYLSYCLPFQAMAYTPAGIYTGIIPQNQIAVHLILQVFWIVFMYGLLQFTWSRALKKVTVLGG